MKLPISLLFFMPFMLMELCYTGRAVTPDNAASDKDIATLVEYCTTFQDFKVFNPSSKGNRKLLLPVIDRWQGKKLYNKKDKPFASTSELKKRLAQIDKDNVLNNRGRAIFVTFLKACHAIKVHKNKVLSGISRKNFSKAFYTTPVRKRNKKRIPYTQTRIEELKNFTKLIKQEFENLSATMSETATYAPTETGSNGIPATEAYSSSIPSSSDDEAGIGQTTTFATDPYDAESSGNFETVNAVFIDPAKESTLSPRHQPVDLQADADGSGLGDSKASALRPRKLNSSDWSISSLSDENPPAGPAKKQKSLSEQPDAPQSRPAIAYIGGALGITLLAAAITLAVLYAKGTIGKKKISSLTFEEKKAVALLIKNLQHKHSEEQISKEELAQALYRLLAPYSKKVQEDILAIATNNKIDEKDYILSS